MQGKNTSDGIGEKDLSGICETKAVEQKIQQEGEEGSGDKLQDLPINSKRIFHGIEVTSCIIVEINGFNRIFQYGNAGSGKFQEHIHFVFISIAGDCQKIRNQLFSKATQTGLGISDRNAGGERKDLPGNGISQSGTQRRAPGLCSGSKEQTVFVFLSFLQEEQRILQGVLSVRVHGNDLEIPVQCLEIGEPCF